MTSLRMHVAWGETEIAFRRYLFRGERFEPFGEGDFVLQCGGDVVEDVRNLAVFELRPRRHEAVVHLALDLDLIMDAVQEHVGQVRPAALGGEEV